jgi:hypothetical protein
MTSVVWNRCLPTSHVGQKVGSPVAVIAASDNSGVEDTDEGPADDEMGGAAPVSLPRSRR